MKVKVLNAQTQIEVREINLHEFTATTGECLLGRSPNSGLVLDSPDVSRLHAKFALEDGQYYFYDLGSANGSLVNGQVAKANQGYLLQPGDILRMGEFILILQEFNEVLEDLPATVVGDPDATVVRISQPNEMNVPVATSAAITDEPVNSLVEEEQLDEQIAAVEAASPIVDEQNIEAAEPPDFIETMSGLADEPASVEVPQFETSEDSALTSEETVIQLDEETSEAIEPIDNQLSPLSIDESSVTQPIATDEDIDQSAQVTSPSEPTVIQSVETDEAIDSFSESSVADEAIEDVPSTLSSELIESNSSDSQLEDAFNPESEPLTDALALDEATVIQPSDADTLVPDEATVIQSLDLEEDVDDSSDLTSSVVADESLPSLSESVTSVDATVIQSLDELLPEPAPSEPTVIQANDGSELSESASSEPTVIQSNYDLEELTSEDQATPSDAVESVMSSDATVIQSIDDMQEDVDAPIDSLSTPAIASDATVIQSIDQETIDQLPDAVPPIETSQPSPESVASEPVHFELEPDDVWGSSTEELDEPILSESVVEERDREPISESDVSAEVTSVDPIEDAVTLEKETEVAIGDEPTVIPAIEESIEDASAVEETEVVIGDEPTVIPAIDSSMTEATLPGLSSSETAPSADIADQDQLLEMPTTSGPEPTDLESLPVAETNEQLPLSDDADDAESLESIDESDRLIPPTVNELDLDPDRTVVPSESAIDSVPELTEESEELETVELETVELETVELETSASANPNPASDQTLSQIIDEPVESSITNLTSDLPEVSITESTTLVPETVDGEIPVPVVEVTETVTSVEAAAPVSTPIDETPPILKQKYIALMAHDSQRAELIQFVSRHKDFLSQCLTIATPSVSDILKQQIGIKISQQTPAMPPGGYQAVNSLIVSNQVLAVIFLRDFFTPHSTQANDEALSRSCNVNNVLLANNVATAEAIVHYISTAVVCIS